MRAGAFVVLAACAQDPSVPLDPMVDHASPVVPPGKRTIPGPARLDLYLTRPGVDGELDDDLVRLIDRATSSIDLAIYSFNRQNLIDALIAAALRGVRVRMVGDGDNASDAGYAALSAAGIPQTLRPAGDGIMHDKFMVVDERYLWVGSANATTAAMTLDDNDALIIESPELAAAYRAEHEEMFVGRRFGAEKALHSGPHEATVNGVRIQAFFGPRESLMTQLLDALSSAQVSARFLIFNMARPSLRDRLIELHAGGVKVAGVFDRLQAGGSDSQDESLAGGGVSVWLDGNNHSFGGGNMHHKLMIIDGESGSDPTVVTGSFNWTLAADSTHDENLVVIHSSDVARGYLEQFCSVVSLATLHPLLPGTRDPGCAGRIVVNEALPNPTGTDAGNEYVELANVGLTAVGVSDHTVSVGTTVRHRFPAGFIMPAGSLVTLYDRGAHTNPGDLVASTGGLSLVNTGATVVLRNGAGAVLDVFQYPGATEGVAFNRTPDLTVDGKVVVHRLVPRAVGDTSPGRAVDQTKPAVYGSMGQAGPLTPDPRELIITQLATRGARLASDEFVELYNATDHELDVGGVRIQYQSASCSGFFDRYTVPLSTRLAQGGFLLFANPTGYLAPGSGVAPDGALSGSGFADNGSIRLVAANGIELDRVAYGSPACAGEGGSVAPNHGTSANGASVARRPGSYSLGSPAEDTNDNAADFVVSPGRNPRSSASPPEPSRGVIRPAPGELLMTQLATRGLTSAADELVELCNASNHSLTVDGVRLRAQAASCGSTSDRHTVAAGVTLAPGQFYLLANPAGYVSPGSGPAADGTLSAAMGDNGVLSLVGSDGALLDKLAFGTGLSCTGEGGTVAPNHGTVANGRSIARRPRDQGRGYSPAEPAQDTDDNSADFAVTAARAPRTTQSPREPSR